MGAVRKATKDPFICSSYDDVNIWDSLQLRVCPEDSRLNEDSDKMNRRDFVNFAFSLEEKTTLRQADNINCLQNVRSGSFDLYMKARSIELLECQCDYDS